MVEEKKSFKEWNLGKAPIGYLPNGVPISRVVAEAVVEYAIKEEREIVGAYPCLLRPLVRWVRRAANS